MPRLIPATGCTLHVVGVWINRIGKLDCLSCCESPDDTGWQQPRPAIGPNAILITHLPQLLPVWDKLR